jgi:zinc transport system substrate-binding protein
MKNIVCAAAMSAALLAGGSGTSAQPAAAEKVVLATTSWTAAFVQAAGFTGRLHVLAPANLQHPPEYELRPSDIQMLASADLIVFAGYERMVGQIRDAVAKKKVRLLQIKTDYSPATLRESLDRLAGEFGTQPAAQASLAKFESVYADIRNSLKMAGAPGGDVICQAMQAPFIRELGLSIKGVFGPAPLEPGHLGNLTGRNPRLIVDNWHNPVAGPLKVIYPGAPLAVLINFPGPAGTLSLADVLEYNGKELLKALR